MNVCGLASITSCPSISPTPAIALESLRLTRMPCNSARRSIVRKPRLCSVSAYSSPGFPRPATRNMTPYFFFLALLDDFGFGGSAGDGCRGFRRGGNFLGAQRDGVRDDAIGSADQLHGAGERHIARALALPDHQLGHIDGEAVWNLVRQAFDFDGAGDDFEQAALHFNALRFTAGMYRNGNANTLGEIDAFEIGMQQVALDRVHLLIHHHHRGGLSALNRQVEDGVVPRAAASDLGDLAGVDRDADGVFECAIQDGRNVSGTAGTARFVLAARGTHLGGYVDIFSHYISPLGFEVRFTPLPGLTWVRGPANSNKQDADRSLFVNRSNVLCQQPGDRQRFDPARFLRLRRKRNRIRKHYFFEARCIDEVVFTNSIPLS